ncbi:hypothetical protein LCGC14_2485260, partial [marine sediment metagenome]
MKNDFPLIVGIGASAGGISALSQLFGAVPRNSGMAFVIVTHLNPDRESQLHSVLANQTDMAVKIAANGQKIEADTVYVMPEKKIITMKGTRLQLQD